MVCWSKEKIAAVGQYYFLGYGCMFIMLWAPEVLGRFGAIKYLGVPVAILAHILNDYFPNNYTLSQVCYFLVGLSNMKV